MKILFGLVILSLSLHVVHFCTYVAVDKEISTEIQSSLKELKNDFELAMHYKLAVMGTITP